MRAMMSAHVLHAGEGYAYLMNSVATADEETSVKTDLFDYYESRGTPPGRWFGSGIVSLGECSVEEGGIVTEEQMATLYGEGLHPDADALLEDGATLAEVQLGRAFPLYSDGDESLKKIHRAEKTKREELGRRLTTQERSDLVVATVSDDYRADTGDRNARPKDVVAWAREKQNSVRQATSGFDLTFSPVKSVSMLWALGSKDVREAIEQAHHDAVNETLHWVEDNALYTRDSTSGVGKLTKTSGMIAAQFDHFETRAGDPDLHTHVAVSNKVFDPAANKWKSIEGRSLLRHVATASSRYNLTLMDKLTESLGVQFAPRGMGEGKIPVYEIDGIPDSLSLAGSKRRQSITDATQALVDDYVTRHGRSPSSALMYKLSQQATLSTREGKGEASSLADLRGRWRAEFAEVAGGQQALDTLMSDVTNRGSESTLWKSEQVSDTRLQVPGYGTQERGIILATIAAEAVRLAGSRRTNFTDRHLDSAVSQTLRGYRPAAGEKLMDLHAQVIKQAKDHAISLTPEVTQQLPDKLLQAGDLPIDRTTDFQRYTSPEVMREEAVVDQSARTPVGFTVPESSIAHAIARYDATNDFALNAGQAAMVRHLAATGTQTAVAVGPAGSGKTTSMAILADVWRQQGHKVVALSAQKSAARTLGSEIDAPGMTLASLVYPWQGKYDGVEPGDVSNLPVSLSPGDMLLVDEAGMATTADLAALTEIANATGAVIRMVGDPQQLGPVGRGGIFSRLCETTNAVELDTVVRMGADTVQAENTMALRQGKTEALDLFYERGWVHSGGRANVINQAVRDHLSDRAQGKHSLIIAPTNRDVGTINSLIQKARVAAGDVDLDGPTIALRDATAGVGDTLLARRNAKLPTNDGRRVEIDNSELLRLDLVLPDGSALTRRMDAKGKLGESVHIPQWYLQSHMQLGYGCTVHRSQGATVEITRGIVDKSVSRQLAYVAVTRGKEENHFYPVTDGRVDTAVDAEDQHQHMAGDTPADEGRAVLESILARDDSPVAAHTIRDRAAADEFSLERTEQLYGHAAVILAREYGGHRIDHHLSYLPGIVAASIDDDARERLAAIAGDLVTTRTDHEAVIADAVAAADGTEKDAAGLIAYRLKAALPDRDDPARPRRSLLAPHWNGQDSDLRIFADSALERLSEHSTGVGDGYTLVDADLRGVDLRGRTLTGVTLINCQIDGMSLDGATLSGVRFIDCHGGISATGARLGTDAHSTETVFRNCDLTGSDFSTAQMQRVRFTRGDLGQATFDGATIVHTNMQATGIHGLSAQDVTVDGNLSLVDVDLDGSDLADLVDYSPTPDVDELRGIAEEDYREGVLHLAGQFATHELATRLEALPVASHIDDAGMGRVSTSATLAALSGVDFREHWLELTGDIETVSNVPSTLARRIDALVVDHAAVPQLPPRWAGQDDQLHEWVAGRGIDAGLIDPPSEMPAAQSTEEIAAELATQYTTAWMDQVIDRGAELTPADQQQIIAHAAGYVTRGLDLDGTSLIAVEMATSTEFGVGETPVERVLNWIDANASDLDDDAEPICLPPSEDGQDMELRAELEQRREQLDEEEDATETSFMDLFDQSSVQNTDIDRGHDRGFDL